MDTLIRDLVRRPGFRVDFKSNRPVLNPSCCLNWACDSPHGSKRNNMIWENHNDLTPLPSPGISGSYREIIPKWPQDSGYCILVIYPDMIAGSQ